MLPKGNEDVAYSAMMTAYKAHGSNVESLEVFGLMQRAGVEPDNIVPLVCAAKACSNMEAVIDGKLVHCIVTEKKAESNLYAGSALIGMYVKCGSISEACNVFERLPEKNEVTWSSMISAFAEVNDFGLASAYFEGMQKAGIKPNGVTFLAILSACSHAGTLSEGVEHFNSMWEERNLVPMGNHYNCLVDLLGRTGNVVEAEDLLHTMPYCPDAIGCMALLSHCKTHGNVEVGKMCFRNYVHMDLRDASSFSLMTEIYSDCCMAADAEMIEKWRIDARAFKKAGRASICIDREVHTFDVGSLRGHESDLDICRKLGNVHAQLKVNGYFPFLD
jgi:pentatricopeptide repeat protein